MRSKTFARGAILSLAVATLALGCGSLGGSDEPAPPPPIAAPEPTESYEPPPETRGLLATIYFDFDSSVLRSDQRPSLDQNAAKIRDNADWKTVVIEGHCDERGSEEYNLALGDRRASAVKRYFMDSGISGGRIDTVSYGESQPAATGHDESSWRLNRRAEFTVVR